MNSVLQCLTYTPPLLHYIRTGGFKATKQGQFCALTAMMQHTDKALATGSKRHSPTPFAHHLRDIGRNFRLGRQEDAHEFVRYLTQAMGQSYLRSVGEIKAHFRVQDTNPIGRMFGGMLQSEVKCTQCGHCSRTFDHFQDLSIEVKRAASIESSLSQYTAVERLEGDNKYRCSRCRTLVEAEKRLTIREAPPILVVHLKRFAVDVSGQQGRKLDKHVAFGEKLNLAPYMSGSSGRGGAAVAYRLYGNPPPTPNRRWRGR